MAQDDPSPLLNRLAWPQPPKGEFMTDVNLRKPAHPIDAMFLQRWSPRAFTDEVISEAYLLTILEAARWAPSSFNAQPWRFLYARRRTPQWEKFLQLLVPFNKGWAKDAAALIVLVSNSMSRPSGGDEDVPSYTHSLDAGTASGYFALQANRLGWHAHGMVGFNIDRACKDLNVPPGYRVEAVYAIGRKGDPAHLPAQLRAREFPNDRLPLCELAFEGGFPTEPTKSQS
jgi:nitroreductase